MAHLTGTAVERVYRVSPTRNPAEYDPEELYLHLRDEHDLRVEAAKEQPYSPPRSDATHKAPSRRVRLATADQVGRALLEASKRRKREAHSPRWRLVGGIRTGRRVRMLLRRLNSQIVLVAQM